FFFNDTATTEIYTLSLHDALPIFDEARLMARSDRGDHDPVGRVFALEGPLDRKSTRLNSSHSSISYDVFCLENRVHAAFTRQVVEARDELSLGQIARSSKDDQDARTSGFF